MHASRRIALTLFLLGIILIYLIVVYLRKNNQPDKGILFYTYTIVNTYPHDASAFTQGLMYDDGFLYEGTGRYGYSTLRKVNLETGKVIQLYTLPEKYFGEGITIHGNRIIQLTLDSKTGFIYDKETFNLLKNFEYATEGWGITHDGKNLIMSDGSATLYFLDSETFKEVSRIVVRDGKAPVTKLNELEYVKGEIFANIWKSNRIIRIDPETGKVIGWIDLTGILSPDDHKEPVDVLNGIAYDAANDRLFVTGKLWPVLFEIKLISREY